MRPHDGARHTRLDILHILSTEIRKQETLLRAGPAAFRSYQTQGLTITLQDSIPEQDTVIRSRNNGLWWALIWHLMPRYPRSIFWVGEGRASFLSLCRVLQAWPSVLSACFRTSGKAGGAQSGASGCPIAGAGRPAAGPPAGAGRWAVLTGGGQGG